MLTCKLCNTRLEKKHLRRDGSMLCPICGQVYWKAAVEKALREAEPVYTHVERTAAHVAPSHVAAPRHRRPALRSA